MVLCSWQVRKRYYAAGKWFYAAGKRFDEVASGFMQLARGLMRLQVVLCSWQVVLMHLARGFMKLTRSCMQLASGFMQLVAICCRCIILQFTIFLKEKCYWFNGDNHIHNCLFYLILYVPVNDFSVIWGQVFLG